MSYATKPGRINIEVFAVDETDGLSMRPRFSFDRYFAKGPMCSRQKQTPELDIRARIARLSEAEEKGAKPSASGDELRMLSAMAARLDQLLAKAAEAEVQELHSASSRLDQLLSDISKGKDVRTKLKRRDQPQNR